MEKKLKMLPLNKDIETKASKVKFPANKAVTIKINLPL